MIQRDSLKLASRRQKTQGSVPPLPSMGRGGTCGLPTSHGVTLQATREL